MGEVNLTINGRTFGIACDDGQEARVQELGQYLEQRVSEITRAGAANNETHAMMLASLLLADEIFDLREQVSQMGGQAQETSTLKQDELAIAEAIDHLSERIEGIAKRVQSA